VATLQLEHGVLQPDVREQTLRAIGRWGRRGWTGTRGRQRGVAR
jgi:hypothetical protein